jgi:hypothetical protein
VRVLAAFIGALAVSLHTWSVQLRVRILQASASLDMVLVAAIVSTLCSPVEAYRPMVHQVVAPSSCVWSGKTEIAPVAGSRRLICRRPPVLADDTHGTLMALGIQKAARGAPVGGIKVYLLDFVTGLHV